MLNGMEIQTVGAAYLKALRPTAVLVNGTCRKLCEADRRVLEGVYVGKIMIKAAKRIFNSDKICRSYSDLNFGVTFFGTQCS